MRWFHCIALCMLSLLSLAAAEERPWLGITLETSGGFDARVVIRSVKAESTAAEMGLKKGDILSDIAAQIAGSVGLAGTANIGQGCAMFEAIHGSAPDIAGRDIANPSGLLLAAVQMLIHVGQPRVAEQIHNAWLKTIEDGVHTAGTSSQISDGASALVVMSEEAAEKRGLEPLATITGYATGGTEPQWVMYAPVVAMENLKARTGVENGAYDLAEVNEAFASAACAVTNEAGLDAARTNVNGGAVALGHPIGASGARILTTLLYAMKNRGAETGLATLCLGGGNAVALSVKR